MPRLYLAASFALVVLMLTVAPAQGVTPRPTPPPTNTAYPRTAVALVPSLTSVPCPAPIEVHETIDGVAYSGVLKAAC